MRNRKIIFIIAFAVLSLLLILSQVWIIKHSKSVPKEILTSLEKSTMQSVILYSSFVFAMTNDGVKLEGLRKIISEREDKVISISNNKPFFILYFPLSEDVCTSCVVNAYTSVREVFDDFSENDRFVILAEGQNPHLNSRVLGKHIYHGVPDTCGLNMITNPQNMPYYFILNANMEAACFFIPNAFMPDLTEKYLKIIQEKYFTEQAISN